MKPSYQLPPLMFKLEGPILGFLGGEPHQPKSIVLEVEEEQMAIRLPLERQNPFQKTLKPGDRVCCIGRSQVDFQAGVIELQAYHLYSVAS